MDNESKSATVPAWPVVFFRSRLFYFLVIGVGALSILASGLLAYSFYQGSRAEQTVTLIVKKGAGVGAVSRQLVDQQAIQGRYTFVLGAVVYRAQGDLRAGEYVVPQGATMVQILSMLRKGDTVARRLSIPEGLSVVQIIRRLQKVDSLTGEVLILPAEGSLLPETYYYSLLDTRQEIVDRMQRSMREGVARLWPERQESLPFSTPEEAIILASIIEKETSRNSERRHIAGVFVNRLRQGIPLQSDPTIIYGITGGEPLGRGLRRSEIKKKTAYNTYHFKGLPPKPISNPGLAAIAAVLDPLETTDLFFVADGTGGHAFAQTYKEHKRNVRAWRNSRK